MGNQWAAGDERERPSSTFLTQKSKYHPRTKWSDGGDWGKGWEAPNFPPARAGARRDEWAREKEPHACSRTALTFREAEGAQPAPGLGTILGLPQPWSRFSAWLLQLSSKEQVRGMNFAQWQRRHLLHPQHSALVEMAIMPQRSHGSQGCAGRVDFKKSFYKCGENKELREIKFGERKLSFFWVDFIQRVFTPTSFWQLVSV